jgi:hypothetical protein
MNSVYKLFVCVICLTVLVMASIAVAANDPFTGTWGETVLLTLAPYADGISLQTNKEKLNIAHYGKDSLGNDGSTFNLVRVDDHTLKSTSSQDGKVIAKDTGTVSSDGKHYTRIRKATFAGKLLKTTYEYDKVGSVPTGDAFFGTWRETSPLMIYTIKVDGDMFYIARSGGMFPETTKLRIKLDGKDYKGTLGETNQARRIDAQTIEIISEYPATKLENKSDVKDLYQVKGNTLIQTYTETRSGREPSKSIDRFKRIK